MPRGRKKSESPKEREAIYLDPDLRAWAQEQADKDGLTFSQYTCSLLRAERTKTKFRSTLARKQLDEK